MGKSDDDLKIDISDLFGGDVSDVKETVERVQKIASDMGSLSLSEREELTSLGQKSAEERTREEQAAIANLQIEQALREKEAEIERKYQEMLAVREKELEERTKELEEHLQKMRSATPAKPVAPAPKDVPLDFTAPMPPPFSASRVADESAVSPDPLKTEEMKRLQQDHEFFMLYDEIRNLFILELSPLVGEKKTHTMLARTVEMARARHPDAFKNANWDWDGNIIANGKLDNQRLLENRKMFPPGQGDFALDTAFRTLLELRLKALEKGLGTGMMNKVLSRINHWINLRIEKAQQSGYELSNLQRIRRLIPA